MRPVKASKNRKGQRARREAFRNRKPYAYNENQMRKQFPVAPAVYAPTLVGPVSQQLNLIPTGNSDNTRLSDKIIVTGCEVLGTLRQISTGTVTTHTPITSRMLIVSYVDDVNNVLTSNPLTSFDPRATIDNTVVPDRCEIFFDSGPLMTTPSLTGATAIEVYTKTYNFKKYVKFDKPVHITRQKRKYGGVESTYTSGSSNTQNGTIVAIFLSDDASAVDSVNFNVGFQLEFADFVKGFEASMNARLNLVEERMARSQSQSSIVKRVEYVTIPADLSM